MMGKNACWLWIAVAGLDIKLWEEEQFEMLQDVYSLKEDVRPVFEDITFEKLLMKNNAKCRASEQLQLDATQENMLQICCAEGSVQIDTHEISRKRGLCRGNSCRGTSLYHNG